MASSPVFDVSEAGEAGRIIDRFACALDQPRPEPDAAIDIGRDARQLCIYPARAGYDLRSELDFLANRVMEPNVFFTGRFLAPAMPRLEDRIVRLLVMRDENDARSRLRLMMPFSVDRPAFAIGAPVIRVWSHYFGPVGTPLVDAERAAETLDDLLAGLGRKEMGLPSVLVLPDLRIEGPVAELLKAVAIARGLSVTVTETFQRPMLDSEEDGVTYLAGAISKSHRKEMRRQWRLLEQEGALSYSVLRQPEDIRPALEVFLALEATGWKGRRRSAMVSDRYRAAFAREAVGNLAEIDAVRIHQLSLDGKAIAILIVFLMAGEAYTWKTAFDERYSAFSPGKLLIQRLMEQHLEDPNIVRTDSCAVPDHPIVGRMWRERCTMGTMIIGLNPNRDRDVRQTAAQMHLYRNTRSFARQVRDRLRTIARRRGLMKR